MSGKQRRIFIGLGALALVSSAAAGRADAGEPAAAIPTTTTPTATSATSPRAKPASTPAAGEYRLDPKQSRLIVETETTGLSTMFGHNHRIAVGEMAGTVRTKRGTPSGGTFEITAKASSLEMMAKASSLRVIDSERDAGERQAIEAALRDEMLETSKYPDIAFKTTRVTSERRADGSYDVRLAGDLRLHGMRRAIVIPARVTVEGDTLHALGVFEVKQTDFNITPFSFVRGTVAIRDAVPEIANVVDQTDHASGTNPYYEASKK